MFPCQPIGIVKLPHACALRQFLMIQPAHGAVAPLRGAHSRTDYRRLKVDSNLEVLISLDDFISFIRIAPPIAYNNYARLPVIAVIAIRLTPT